MTTQASQLTESRSLTMARLIAEQVFDKAVSNISSNLAARGYTKKSSTPVLVVESPKEKKLTPQEKLIQLSELEQMSAAESFQASHASPNGSPTVVFKLNSKQGRKFVLANEKLAKANKRSISEIQTTTIKRKGRTFVFQTPVIVPIVQKQKSEQIFWSQPSTFVLTGKETLSKARRKFVLSTITKKSDSGTLGRGKPIVINFTSAFDIIHSQYETVSNPDSFTGNDLTHGSMIAESKKPRKSVLPRDRKSLRVEIFEGKTRLSFEKSKRKLDSLSSFKLVSSVLPKLKKSDFESVKIASKESGKVHTLKHGKYTLKFYWMSH